MERRFHTPIQHKSRQTRLSCMRNDECTIIITSNDGKPYQTIRKQNNTWTQTVLSNGSTHTMTAEQLLSHILPALAYKHATIKVIPDNNTKNPKHTHPKNNPRDHK